MANARFKLAVQLGIATLLFCHLPGPGYGQSNTSQEKVSSIHSKLGVVSSKPSSGLFVKHRDVFLVPYSFTIPGTKKKIDMVPIPEGDYLLPFKNKEDKTKYIVVKVEPFWMAKTETTWGQYEPFMDLDKAFREFERLKIRKVTDKNKVDAVATPSLIYDMDFRRNACGGKDNHPAATMSQFAAKAYTEYLSKLTGTTYRLPSAIEWRYAAKAERYSAKPVEFSDKELSERAWFGDDPDVRSLVGKKAPNKWGLYDMLGNVSEWVLDGENYDPDIFKGMTVSSIDAVAWPRKRHGRLALGGSFFDPPEKCQIDSQRVSDEDLWDFDPMIPLSPHWTASDDSQGIGFRIIRPFRSKISPDLAKKYWEPDHKEIRDAIRYSYDSRGAIAIGIVDQDLPKAIEKLPKKKKRK